MDLETFFVLFRQGGEIFETFFVLFRQGGEIFGNVFRAI
jgi:hypothetical protein